MSRSKQLVFNVEDKKYYWCTEDYVLEEINGEPPEGRRYVIVNLFDPTTVMPLVLKVALETAATATAPNGIEVGEAKKLMTEEKVIPRQKKKVVKKSGLTFNDLDKFPRDAFIKPGKDNPCILDDPSWDS